MKTNEKQIKPLSQYKEDLIYMAYRYAIGRHTIQSHAIAKDIIKNEYYRMLLNPDRTKFMSKDINRSIEDVLRWHNPSLFITNYNQVNVYPYELYQTVAIKEEEKGNTFKPSIIKKIEVTVDNEGNYVSHSIKYNTEKDISSTYIDDYDMTVHDLEIWNQVAKILDLDKHKTCTLINGEECEYVDILVNKTMYKVPVKEFVNNPYIFTYIPDDKIKS